MMFLKNVLAYLFPPNCSKKERALQVFFLMWSAYALILPLFRVLKSWNNAKNLTLQGLSDFLINYQGGFVRRGLIGELIFQLYSRFGVNPYHLVAPFCLLSFYFVAFFLIKQFYKRGYPTYVLFLCFTLAGPAVTGGLSFFRRDFFLIAVLIFCLWLYNKIRFNVWVFVVNLVAVITLLAYEPFIFISLPIFFLLALHYLKEKKCRHAVLCAGVLVLPQLLTFLLLSLFKGNVEMAQAIWESVKPMYGDNCPDEIPHLIGFLGWSTADVIKYHLSRNFLSVSYKIPAIVAQPRLFMAIYYLVTNIVPTFARKKIDAINKAQFSYILVFQFVCFLPMWLVLSCDYLRLLSSVVLSSFVIFFLIPQNIILEIMPKKATDIVDKLNDKLCKFVYPSKYVLAFLLLFVTMCTVGFALENTFYCSIIGHIAYRLLYNLLWQLL